jgi:hypothetical protein
MDLEDGGGERVAFACEKCARTGNYAVASLMLSTAQERGCPTCWRFSAAIVQRDLALRVLIGAGRCMYSTQDRA